MARKKRQPQPTSSLKEENFLLLIARSALISCTLFACFLVAGLFKRPVVLPQCVASGSQNVLSDQHIYGELFRHGGQFLVRAFNGNVRSLAKCARNGCSGPYSMLEKERIGTLTHAEFCGPFLTSVSLNDVLIYTAQPPTQAELDAKAATLHKTGFFALLFVLTVLLAVILFCAHQHRKSRASS